MRLEPRPFKQIVKFAFLWWAIAFGLLVVVGLNSWTDIGILSGAFAIALAVTAVVCYLDRRR